MRILKYLCFIVITVFCILLFYILLALTLSVISTGPASHVCDKDHQVLVASNGIHLDIFIPVDLLSPSIRNRLSIPLETKLVGFGWGDRQFYLETPTWDDLKWTVAIRALLLKGPAAMHVTFYPGIPNGAKSIELCEWQYTQLSDYIDDTFKRDSLGQFIELEGAGYTDDDRFYEAKGDFSFIKTCNEWVNAGLKRAKVRTSIWSPFDYGVLFHL